MNSLVAALIIGVIIALLLGIMRSREDADKGMGAYMIKVLIIVCPVLYLAFTYISSNGGMTGGSGGSSGMGAGCGLDMRTGYPDF